MRHANNRQDKFLRGIASRLRNIHSGMLQSMLSLHGKIAGMTLLALLLWAVTQAKQLDMRADVTPDTEIALEHEQRATVILNTTDGTATQIMDVQNPNDFSVYMSAPDTWKRTEVRGSPLENVTAEDAGLQFTRWHIPARSTVRFEITQLWQHITVHHPVSSLLNLRITRANVRTNTVEQNAYLLDEGTHELH